jgi:hypothetical protein
MRVQNQNWAAYDKVHGLTPELEARAVRLRQETRTSSYPKSFSHNGRRMRLNLVKRYGPIAQCVMLVDVVKKEEILMISRPDDAVIYEATR